jgi:hypothetical protein
VCLKCDAHPPQLPDQLPLSSYEGLTFLLMFPRDPCMVSLEAAEQFLGLRPRPPVHYHISRPRPSVGSEWLDLPAW